jgi:hypothetical protein
MANAGGISSTKSSLEPEYDQSGPRNIAGDFLVHIIHMVPAGVLGWLGVLIGWLESAGLAKSGQILPQPPGSKGRSAHTPMAMGNPCSSKHRKQSTTRTSMY